MEELTHSSSKASSLRLTVRIVQVYTRDLSRSHGVVLRRIHFTLLAAAAAAAAGSSPRAGGSSLLNIRHGVAVCGVDEEEAEQSRQVSSWSSISSRQDWRSLCVESLRRDVAAPW